MKRSFERFPCLLGKGGMYRASTFNSFFMAGFECSAHRRRDRRRLDLIAATDHDRFVTAD